MLAAPDGRVFANDLVVGRVTGVPCGMSLPAMCLLKRHFPHIRAISHSLPMFRCPNGATATERVLR